MAGIVVQNVTVDPTMQYKKKFKQLVSEKNTKGKKGPPAVIHFPCLLPNLTTPL